MAAPKGNEFWKLRSKHGRETFFSSPTLMWEAACEYFEWCTENPINDPRSYKQQAYLARPFTWQGLCRHLGTNLEYFRKFEKELEKKEQSEEIEDFLRIIKDIRDVIYQQKFEQAVVGNYSSIIISRDLELTDKSHLDLSSSKDTLKDVFEPLLKKSDE